MRCLTTRGALCVDRVRPFLARGSIGAPALALAVAAATLGCSGAEPRPPVAAPTVDPPAVPAPTRDAPARVPHTIAVGTDFSCAIEGGRLLCWGGGDSRPSPVGGLDGLVEVAASGDAICGLDDQGAVSCLRSWRGDPVSITLDAEAHRIGVGRDHACAILSDRTIQCWGLNRFGQLGSYTGLRDREHEASPEPPVQVAGIDDALDLAAGSDFTCAVLDGGQAVCWGINLAHQLGNPILSGRSEFRAIPVLVAGLSDAERLGLGNSAACAVRRGGAVTCWGGASEDEQYAGEPWLVSGVDDAVQIAGALVAPHDSVIDEGDRNACILGRDGGVRCWPTTSCACTQRGCDCGAPRQHVFPSHVVEIVSGPRHQCVRTADGAVWCWGRGVEGQLGRGPQRPAIVRSPIAGISDAVQLVSGTGLSCARRATGQVVCWGRPARCGREASGPGGSDVVEVPGLGPVDDLILESDTLCARSRDGRVLCTEIEARSAQPCRSSFGPVAEANSLRGAIAIAGGRYELLGIVPARGIVLSSNPANSYGEEEEEELLPRALAKNVVRNALAIEGTDERFCLRLRSGAVTCSVAEDDDRMRLEPIAGIRDAVDLVVRGDGAYVTRADGTVTEVVGRSEQRPVGGLGDVVQVSVGSDNRCALTRRGEVLCWGNDDHGELGRSVAGYLETPTRVDGVGDAIDVSTAEDHTCAILRDRSVVCWGSNRYGVLGSAFHDPDLTPAPVLGLGGERGDP
jgi:alpha-tubulin suppressor-like RCC1 family protein